MYIYILLTGWGRMTWPFRWFHPDCPPPLPPWTPSLQSLFQGRRTMKNLGISPLTTPHLTSQVCFQNVSLFSQKYLSIMYMRHVKVFTYLSRYRRKFYGSPRCIVPEMTTLFPSLIFYETMKTFYQSFIMYCTICNGVNWQACAFAYNSGSYISIRGIYFCHGSKRVRISSRYFSHWYETDWNTAVSVCIVNEMSSPWLTLILLCKLWLLWNYRETDLL